MSINKNTEKITSPIAVIITAIILAVGFYMWISYQKLQIQKEELQIQKRAEPQRSYFN